jgi:hypothetical protein
MGRGPPAVAGGHHPQRSWRDRDMIAVEGTVDRVRARNRRVGKHWCYYRSLAEDVRRFRGWPMNADDCREPDARSWTRDAGFGNRTVAGDRFYTRRRRRTTRSRRTHASGVGNRYGNYPYYVITLSVYG